MSLTIAATVALYFAHQNFQLAATLRDEARIDFLTRIANRRGLEEELRRQHKAVCHSNAWLSVLMIDIDHFKRFNDHYGHTDGDRCLASLASLLRVWASTHHAFVGRYGGEEFMMIMSSDTPEAAREAAETIRLQVEKQSPHCVPQLGSIRTLTVTVGVSSLQGYDLGTHFDALIEAADQALYLGKAQGRNRVVEQAALPSNLTEEALA
jgi:diguanylate cyclase (GGDEF)-like protein